MRVRASRLYMKGYMKGRGLGSHGLLRVRHHKMQRQGAMRSIDAVFRTSSEKPNALILLEGLLDGIVILKETKFAWLKTLEGNPSKALLLANITRADKLINQASKRLDQPQARSFEIKGLSLLNEISSFLLAKDQIATGQPMTLKTLRKALDQEFQGLNRFIAERAAERESEGMDPRQNEDLEAAREFQNEITSLLNKSNVKVALHGGELLRDLKRFRGEDP